MALDGLGPCVSLDCAFNVFIRGNGFSRDQEVVVLLNIRGRTRNEIRIRRGTIVSVNQLGGLATINLDESRRALPASPPKKEDRIILGDDDILEVTVTVGGTNGGTVTEPGGETPPPPIVEPPVDPNP